MSTFNQGVPGVATLINSSAVILSGNAASANALTVRQFGGGNVFSAQTTTGATALFVGSGGNVGIGATNPQAVLDVRNTAIIGDYAAVGFYNPNAALHCRRTGANNHFIVETTSTSTTAIASITSGSVIGTDMSTHIFKTGCTYTGDFSLTGTERMRINTTGVGIGAANPGGLLQVGDGTNTGATPLGVYNIYNGTGGAIIQNLSTGTAAVSSLALGDSASNNRGGIALFGTGYTASAQYRTSGTYVYNNIAGGVTVHAEAANSNVYIATAGSERMRITSAGLVGIGTASPGYTLDVSSFGVDGGTIRIASSSSCAFRMMEVNDTYGFSFTNVAASRMSIKRHSSSQAGSEIISILRDNPYVGIGITTPTFALHVGRDCTAQGDMYADSAQLTVSNAAGGKRMLIGYDSSAGAGNGFGYFMAGNYGITWTNICFQQNGGNVGIGVTNPVGKLTVSQSSTAALIIGSNTNWSGSSGVVKITGTSGLYAPLGTIFAGTAQDNHWEIVNGNGMVGAVRTSGSTTTYNSLSDYRTKTNVRPLSNALATISQMKPVKFNFKADLNKEVEGFIAHELQEAAPNAVTGEKDAVFADGSINPQCIDMSFLVPFIVAGMQDLVSENTALKTQLAAMDARLAALEAKLAA